jgi:hypothetical protein
MGVKYVKDFSFPSAGGFHSGSVQRYAKGGHVTKLPAKAKDSAKGMPARAKPNAPARGAPKMESKPKVGKGQGYEKGGYVPGKEKDVLPVKRPPGRGKDLAPARRFKGKYEGYAEGGPVDEILPGDGRGGLEVVMPTRDVGRIIEERDLPPLMPLPEEPFYSPQEQRGAVGKLLMPEDRSIYDRPRPEPVDRVGNRRAMMGDRRDMVMRPGMRGVARREAPMRMRTPAPVRQPEVLPFELPPEQRLVPVFKKGGAVKGEKIAKVMREYKAGKLHSGSKKGPVVKNPKQAMAIALSEARAAKKAKGGEIFSDEYMAYESKGPKTRYTAAKGRRMAKERAMERRALDKARHAEKYAPGLSLDMSEYKKGGKVKHSDVKMDKAMVKKAVHKHEKAMHPGKKMTKLNKGGVPSYGRKPMYGGGKC